MSSIPVENIRLIYTGKQLRSSRSLVDYCVGNGTTLDLSERLLGGCYWCHKCRNNPTAPPHRSQNCKDPSNTWSHAHGGGHAGGGGTGRPNGVMLLMSRRGHHVFMATSSGRITTFGGRWDPHDIDSWDTARREYLEEGGNLLPNRASCREIVVTHRNGSTTSYWVGPAPEGTQWVNRPENRETDGGVWMTRRQLEAAHAARNLRFGDRVLEVIRQIGL